METISTAKEIGGHCINVSVSVTDFDVFNDVLSILSHVYKHSSDDIQQYIENELTKILSKTHDVDGVLKG